MPTYEYRCEKGHTFEEFQSMLADPIQVCPLCGAKSERLISAGAGLIFKGSGFYATDYGRGTSQMPQKHKHDDSKSSSESHSESESKPETKSESKPAAESPKTETKSETKSETKTSKPEN
jgi:putative FmdB family regulatory protein